MTTLAYFDCSSGIAGNMILGSLLGAGLDEAAWRRELKKLRLPVQIKVSPVRRGGIRATHVAVRAPARAEPRGLSDVVRLIRRARLGRSVTERSVAIFERLARAEARVHGTPTARVHFHEVGGYDCIVDIVGSALGLEMLNVGRVLASAVNLGSGRVEFSQGLLPVPAPATAELLRGVPVYQAAEATGELVTPTGAAILKELASDFGPLPPMRITSIGQGAGDRKTPWPNVLRLFLGRAEAEQCLPGTDRVLVIETNIDDMNPELFEHVLDRLFTEGALDVYLTPVYMKKNRPATLLSVVAPLDHGDELARVILSETTSLGVRCSETSRVCLEREVTRVKTRFGPVAVKVGRLNDRVVNIAPEYESCRTVARKACVPLKLVYREAQWKAEAITRRSVRLSSSRNDA